MRAVVQRVSNASVTSDGARTGRIDAGLLVYVGVEAEDTAADAEALAAKVAALRIFPDDAGKMNRSVAEAGGGMLAVSAFSTLADARKGNRPSFVRAADPAVAEPLYDAFVAALETSVGPVQRGVFRTMMQVASTNDGPIIILLDTNKTF